MVRGFPHGHMYVPGDMPIVRPELPRFWYLPAVAPDAQIALPAACPVRAAAAAGIKTYISHIYIQKKL